MNRRDTKVEFACGLHETALGLFQKIPVSLLAFLGRFALASVFWLSGQTKIEGFSFSFLTAPETWQFGLPYFASSTLFLFQEEYTVPLLPPIVSAYLATWVENIGAVFLLLGLATRWTALAFLGMTVVIQIFVYPGAYSVHATWAAVLLYLIVYGPGKISLDHLLIRNFCKR